MASKARILLLPRSKNGPSCSFRGPLALYSLDLWQVFRWSLKFNSAPSLGLSFVPVSPDCLFEEAHEILLLTSLHGTLPRCPHGSYGLVCRVAMECD